MMMIPDESAESYQASQALMAAKNPSGLSPRQKQVAELVSRGLPNKLIAHETGLTIHTVKIYLHTIFRTLGVSNRTELAIRMLQRQES